MKSITSEEFRNEIDLDLAWPSKLTEPVEITDYCNMINYGITHLSQLLHFTGTNESGESASFYGCKDLEVAEGSFTGGVSFSESHIKRIGGLTCGINKSGESAFFCSCNYLEIAEGTFLGFVNFSYSKIKKIGDLTCGKNGYGDSSFFEGCDCLKIAEGNFPGFVDFSYSGIEKIENLTCEKDYSHVRLNVAGCKKLGKIPICFHPEEVNADGALLEKLKADRLREAAKKHLITGIVEI